MTWRTITVPTARSGEVVVRAFPTLTPGLVVLPPNCTPHPETDDAFWGLTHARSGLCVGGFDDPESAQRAAVELGEIADWTLSGEELIAADVGPRRAEIVFAAGGWTWANRPASVRSSDRNAP